jgi:hypothetical protein
VSRIALSLVAIEVDGNDVGLVTQAIDAARRAVNRGEDLDLTQHQNGTANVFRVQVKHQRSPVTQEAR